MARTNRLSVRQPSVPAADGTLTRERGEGGRQTSPIDGWWAARSCGIYVKGTVLEVDVCGCVSSFWTFARSGDLPEPFHIVLNHWTFCCLTYDSLQRVGICIHF